MAANLRGDNVAGRVTQGYNRSVNIRSTLLTCKINKEELQLHGTNTSRCIHFVAYLHYYVFTL